MHAATELCVEKDSFYSFTTTAGARQAERGRDAAVSSVSGAWARLLGLGVRRLMLSVVFVTPEIVVQRLADEVQDHTDEQQHHDEHYPQRQRQHLHHGIHPDAALEVDDVYPEMSLRQTRPYLLDVLRFDSRVTIAG